MSRKIELSKNDLQKLVSAFRHAKLMLTCVGKKSLTFVKTSVEYSEKFKIDSHIHALKAFFSKSMNQVDVHDLLVRMFDEIVKSAHSLCKKSNDYIKIFFDKFPSRHFSMATIKVSNLMTC